MLLNIFLWVRQNDFKKRSFSFLCLFISRPLKKKNGRKILDKDLCWEERMMSAVAVVAAADGDDDVWHLQKLKSIIIRQKKFSYFSTETWNSPSEETQNCGSHFDAQLFHQIFIDRCCLSFWLWWWFLLSRRCSSSVLFCLDTIANY